MEIKAQGNVYGLEDFPGKKGPVPMVKAIIDIDGSLQPFKFFVPKNHPQIKVGKALFTMKLAPSYGGGFGAEARLVSVTPVA